MSQISARGILGQKKWMNTYMPGMENRLTERKVVEKHRVYNNDQGVTLWKTEKLEEMWEEKWADTVKNERKILDLLK